MNAESVAELIQRAIAALRERQELPDAGTPPITLTRFVSGKTANFRANVGQALAAGSQDQRASAANPKALAAIVASYLVEVVDIVPAYRDVASVTSADDGSLTIVLRGLETP